MKLIFDQAANVNAPHSVAEQTLQARALNVNSFFAGIGGFDIAFEGEDFRVELQCEINDYCRAILAQHWPTVRRADDINQLDADTIPDATVWCGGFPCQDVSVARAGERQGLRGTRSGLFYRFADLIQARQPEVVILENVTGLLSSNQGRDFRVIVDRFKKMGYAFAWRTLNSRYFGVPQSRPRVLMCAWRDNPLKAGYVMFEASGAAPSDRLGHPRNGFLSPTGDFQHGPIVPEVAYCLAATSGRHTGTDWSRTYVTYPRPARVRRITPVEAEALQGFPRDWTLPLNNDFGGRDEVDSLRYHAAGNAVSVPVIQWLAHRVRMVLTEQVQIPEAPNAAMVSTRDLLKESVADFRGNRSVKILELPDLDDSAELNQVFTWPTAGLSWGGVCVAANVNPAPNRPIPTLLIGFIEQGEVDQRYFLSANAAEGILRRVRNQNRHLFDPLYDALVQMVADRTTTEIEEADPMAEEVDPVAATAD